MNRIYSIYMNKKFLQDRIDYNRISLQYQIPIVKGVDYFDSKIDLVPIDTINRKKQPWDISKCCVHSFRNDQKIESAWNDIDGAIKELRGYNSVMMLDFSLGLDMLSSCIHYNLFRRALTAQIMQDAGLTVIPLAGWAAPNTYAMCFEWLPRNSIIGVSNYAARRNPLSRKYFMNGFRVMVKTIRPKLILFYGTVPVFNFEIPPIIPYRPQWKGSIVPSCSIPYQQSFVWEAC